MGWLKSRFAEPSSWSGLALMVLGAGGLFDISEASVVANAIGEIGAAGLPTWQGVLLVGLGALSAILGEKGKKE